MCAVPGGMSGKWKEVRIGAGAAPLSALGLLTELSLALQTGQWLGLPGKDGEEFLRQQAGWPATL